MLGAGLIQSCMKCSVPAAGGNWTCRKDPLLPEKFPCRASCRDARWWNTPHLLGEKTPGSKQYCALS